MLRLFLNTDTFKVCSTLACEMMCIDDVQLSIGDVQLSTEANAASL